MGRMPVETVKWSPTLSHVVIGPCPGCYLWTLEYELGLFVSVTELHETVEFILQEHLDECSGLQEIVRSIL